MIPGHTKFKCDGSFGLVKKLYRKTTVNCVNDIVEVVKKSSTAGLNKAQRYDNGKAFQYLDLNFTFFDSLIALCQSSKRGQSSTNAPKKFFINKSKTIRNGKLLSLTCLLIFVFFLVHYKLELRFVYGLLFFALLGKFHK